MKVGILGGSFNPPHNGHALIAQQVLKFTKTHQVWLTPCYKHTFEKPLASVANRLAMTKMIISKNVLLCNEEIKNKLSGDSIELMNILKSKYPQHQFTFVIGSDNLVYFKKWGSWEKLITGTDFLVFPRPDFNFDLKKYGLDNIRYLFKLINHPNLKTSSISSTQIRERIKRGLSINNLVPEKVAEYIEENKLYF